MKFHCTTFPLIALAVGTAGIAVAQAQGPYQPFNGSPAAAFVQDHQDDWDAPPQEFREIQRQGYHDGVEAAKKDFDHHRMPDVNNRDEYRHPKVSKVDREDYREGFRRGYDAAMTHLTGTPGPR
jgi:hypothetical protein